MGKFRFTRRAETDLLNIAEYTLRKWGRNQTTRYLNELEACCEALADNPGLGRYCEEIRPGLQRFEHGRHVVFYRKHLQGIFISRILHQQMLPERHSIEGQEEER